MHQSLHINGSEHLVREDFAVDHVQQLYANADIHFLLVRERS